MHIYVHVCICTHISCSTDVCVTFSYHLCRVPMINCCRIVVIIFVVAVMIVISFFFFFFCGIIRISKKTIRSSLSLLTLFSWKLFYNYWLIASWCWFESLSLSLLWLLLLSTSLKYPGISVSIDISFEWIYHNKNKNNYIFLPPSLFWQHEDVVAWSSFIIELPRVLFVLL